jgi:16S rRNA (uracil1498-N3)-methyltransferase
MLVAPGALGEHDTVVLDEIESRHASSVLRLRPGDSLVLADGCGQLAAGAVLAIRRGRLEVEIRSIERQPPPPGQGVAIALSVLHGRTMDWAVQKSVELGVQTFIPVVADRSQLSVGTATGRLEHWRRVARQALKQCRRPWGMELSAPVVLPDLVVRRQDRGGLVADRTGVSPKGLPSSPDDLLLVGPEGGLTDAEQGMLDRAGWLRVRLGPHVLRAETAVVIGASMLMMRQD